MVLFKELNFKIISTNLDDESSDFIDERPKEAAHSDEEDEKLGGRLRCRR